MVDKVLLAEPRGFCAGVEMAIKALTWMVNMFEPPVYCYHEIVHNRWVVEAFQRAGVVFVESIDEVPVGAPVMLSAHGSAPEIIAGADARAGLVIDSVCPLVTKVHHEVKKMAERGYDIIYVGHEGHDEAVGTVAEAPKSITLVEPETGLGDFTPQDPSKVALLAQTTLGMHEWQQVLISAQDRFPDLATARKSDLCYATTNRQDAVRAMADACDLILVVGSVNSSNTQALVRTAETAGTKAYRVDAAEAVDDAWFEGAATVGITAGASAPDHLVQQVIDRVDPREGVELFQTVTEGEYFPLPRQLRGFVAALEHAVIGGMQARPSDDSGPLVRDRHWTATEALEVLTDT
jgi:4-hydroxy-3-methylbut-2-enyl diphosphate reductase